MAEINRKYYVGIGFPDENSPWECIVSTNIKGLLKQIGVSYSSKRRDQADSGKLIMLEGKSGWWMVKKSDHEIKIEGRGRKSFK